MLVLFMLQKVMCVWQAADGTLDYRVLLLDDRAWALRRYDLQTWTAYEKEDKWTSRY